MKKRILALSLALAMMAMMIPTAVFAATLTKTNIIDVDFETGNLTNNISEMSFTCNHNKSTAWKIEEESIRNSKALKIQNNKEAEGGINFRAVTAETISMSDSEVLWYEFSFLQKNAAVGVQMTVGSAGIAIKDGYVQMGHLATSYPTTKLTTLSFGMNRWYHVVFAIDKADRVADTNGQAPKMYLWINGALVDQGSGYTALQDSRSVGDLVGDNKQVRFMILNNAADTNNSGIIYVDNVKAYITDQAVVDGEGTMQYYDPYEIYGNASLTVSNFMQEGTDIYVPETATVADVLNAAEIQSVVRCFKDDAEVKETDYATTKAVGTTLYVTTMSSLIGRSYALLSNKVKTMYYDMNFDTGAVVNTTGYDFGYAGATSTATSGYVADEIRNNKALKLDFAKNGDFYLQGNNNISLDLSDKVTWYELSFMAETAMPAFEIRSQGRAFHVFEDGSMSTGGQAGVAALPANYLVDPDDASKHFKFETGKWYHLVVAIDQIDTYVNSEEEEAAKLYAWVDGCLMHDLTSLSDSYTGLANVNSTAGPLSETKQMNLYASASEAGSLYIDNYKIYTTMTSVADYGYDPMSIYDGAPTPNESYLTADGTIYAPTDTTLDTVKASFSGGTVAESGDTLYALTADGAYAKPYTLTTVDAGYMFVPNTVRLEYENGNKTTVSGLNYTNKVRLRGILTNFGGEAKNGVLVLAAYNGDKLQSCVLTPVTSGTEAMTDYITIGDTEDLTIRAFLWNSTTGLSPAMSTVYSE